MSFGNFDHRADAVREISRRRCALRLEVLEDRCLLSVVSGNKWNDFDADGVQNFDEPGLAGWTIFLDEDNNGELDSGELFDVTGSDGNYAISGVGGYSMLGSTSTATEVFLIRKIRFSHHKP